MARDTGNGLRAEDKFHIPKAEFTIEHAMDELRKAGVEQSLIDDVKKAAEDCEFIRFAPGAEKNAAMQNMYDQLTTVIIDVEKNIVEGNDK